MAYKWSALYKYKHNWLKEEHSTAAVDVFI